MLDRVSELVGFLSYPLVILHTVNKYGFCSCNRCDCPKPGKHPVFPGWQHPQYFSNFIPFENRNIGVLTGYSLLVVDIDPRNGGEATVSALQNKHGCFPETWTSMTPSGGRHLFFSLRDNIILRSCKDTGIDFLLQGSQAVLPTSIAGGQRGDIKEYCWADGFAPYDCKMACAPPWLVAHISRAATRGEGELRSPAARCSSEELAAAEWQLERVSPDTYDTWLKVGFALHASGHCEKALRIWEEWSKASPKFRPGDCRRKWATFRQGEIGLGTIAQLAQGRGL